MNRLTKVILAGVFVAAAVSSAHAQDGAALFSEANALYAEGKFGEAAQKYEQAAGGGMRHWALEYNLGNAHYRQGRLGKAILHFERAFRLNSGNRDVVYNLQLASARAGDPRLPSSALVVLVWRLFYFPSLNTLTLMVSLLFLVLGVSFGLWLAGQRTLSFALWTSVGCVFGVALVWLVVRVYQEERSVGVVVGSLAEVRSGPNTTYPANFTVPEGHRVLILAKQEAIQGWHQIGVPKEGLRGWVPDTAVEMIQTASAPIPQ